MAVKAKTPVGNKKDAKPAKAKSSEIPHIREFKGNNLFAVGDPSAEFASLQIGMRKLKLILAHLDEAKAFVESNGESLE